MHPGGLIYTHGLLKGKECTHSGGPYNAFSLISPLPITFPYHGKSSCGIHLIAQVYTYTCIGGHLINVALVHHEQETSGDHLCGQRWRNRKAYFWNLAHQTTDWNDLGLWRYGSPKINCQIFWWTKFNRIVQMNGGGGEGKCELENWWKDGSQTRPSTWWSLKWPKLYISLKFSNETIDRFQLVKLSANKNQYIHSHQLLHDSEINY